MIENIVIIALFIPIIFVIGIIIALLCGVLLPEKYYVVKNDLGEFRARRGNIILNRAIGDWRASKDAAELDIRQKQEEDGRLRECRELVIKRRTYRRVK